MKVAQVDAALGKARVETNHQRLVFGTNRTQDDVGAVLHAPGADVLHRIRANGQARQVALGHIRRLEHDAGVQSDQSILGSEQRVDIDFLDPALLRHQVAEADQQAFERGQVDGLSSAHAASAVKMLVRSIKSAGERGVERRQSQRAVLIDLDQLSTAPNSNTGPNCGSMLLPRISS